MDMVLYPNFLANDANLGLLKLQKVGLMMENKYVSF